MTTHESSSILAGQADQTGQLDQTTIEVKPENEEKRENKEPSRCEVLTDRFYEFIKITGRREVDFWFLISYFVFVAALMAVGVWMIYTQENGGFIAGGVLLIVFGWLPAKYINHGWFGLLFCFSCILAGCCNLNWLANKLYGSS